MSDRKSQTEFVAYVDESGDEGFVFNPDGSGSTRWFVLSAVVTRRSRDLQMVRCLAETRQLLGRHPKTPLHFYKLRHEQRVPFVRRVSELDIRCINVAVYKPAIREVARFQETKNLLYRYMTRYLIERLSWMLSAENPRGDCSTEIIFSDRAYMSYDDIRSYVRRLLRMAQTDPYGVQINANVINPDEIVSVQHSQLAGLQVADAVATSVYYALNQNRYRETENAYFSHIAKTLYRHNGKVLGYGMKFWPDSYEVLKRKIPQIVDLEDLLH